MVQKSADSIASSRAARLAGNRQREGWRRQKFPHRHAFGLFGRRLRESRVQAFKGLPGVGIAVSGGLPVPFSGLLDVHRDAGPPSRTSVPGNTAHRATPARPLLFQRSWVGFIISVPFPQALSLQLHCKAASPPKRIGSRNVRIQDTTSDKPGGFWRGSVRRTNESHCAIFNVSFAKTSCNPTGHLSTISSPLRLKVLLIAVFSRTPSNSKFSLRIHRSK